MYQFGLGFFQVCRVSKRILGSRRSGLKREIPTREEEGEIRREKSNRQERGGMLEGASTECFNRTVWPADGQARVRWPNWADTHKKKKERQKNN